MNVQQPILGSGQTGGEQLKMKSKENGAFRFLCPGLGKSTS